MFKVSLITVCYNNESSIAATLKSVAKQSYNNIEHIIVDGASTDSTLKIIEDELKKRKSSIVSTVISEPDNGMYEAINKGLNLASGDIVGLLHSDDELYDENTVQTIVDKFITKSNIGLLFANGLFVDSHNPKKVIRNWISREFKSWKIFFGWVPLHTTMYFKKEVVEELGMYETKYAIASDYEYTLRALRNTSIKKYYLNSYIVRMKMGGKSTSMKNQYHKSKEDFTIMRQYKLPAFLTLAFKILRKVPQFI